MIRAGASSSSASGLISEEGFFYRPSFEALLSKLGLKKSLERTFGADEIA